MHTMWELRESEKICGIDIDDTISQSTIFWINFVNEQLSGRYKGFNIEQFKDLNDVKNKLSYNDYRRLKFKFRECGIKADIPIMPGAKELLTGLKGMGYKIILLTARPFQQHRNLFRTTVKWLEKHKLEYDGIVFGKDKNFRILMEVPHLKFMVEDHCSLSNSIGKLGCKVFLLNNKYNYERNLHKNVIRVKKLTEILELVK